jgi:phenylalanyl-tRNA synthetase beta subunit
MTPIRLVCRKNMNFTALVVAAADKLKKPGAAFYEAKKYLRQLVGTELEFEQVSKEMKDYQIVQLFDLNRTAVVRVKGGESFGIIGEFKPSVSRNLKLPKHTAGFEVDTAVLQKAMQSGSEYRPLSRFPSVKQDMTLRVAADLAYGELRDFVAEELRQQAPQDVDVQLADVDIYQKADDPKHKQVTLGSPSPPMTAP